MPSFRAQLIYSDFLWLVEDKGGSREGGIGCVRELLEVSQLGGKMEHVGERRVLHSHPLATAVDGDSSDASSVGSSEGNAVVGDALEHALLIEAVKLNLLSPFCRSHCQVASGEGHAPPVPLLEGDVVLGLELVTVMLVHQHILSI